jgi:hypothetical protein
MKELFSPIFILFEDCIEESSLAGKESKEREKREGK